MRLTASSIAAVLALSFAPSIAFAGTLAFGAYTPSDKVRPMDTSTVVTATAKIKAAKNEFEPFQIVFTATGGDVDGVSVKLTGALTGPGGATIPADGITLYREDYYNVGTASNDEGAPGLWPNPLIPDVDVYFGETRNAFPFTVPSGSSRAVWVDVLVPADATPGDYTGSLEIDVNGAQQGSVAIELHVGTFSLPSTASLASQFGMGWSDPCLAHTGDNYCGASGDLTADKLRALYVRSALEHRFTVSPIDFQPPFGGSQAPFEQTLLPYIDGTGAARLSGAAVTDVTIDGADDSTVGMWIAYAQQKSFFDRLVYYPSDEPGTDQNAWDAFIAHAAALHAADAGAKILITSTIDNANTAGATDDVDRFVPVIDELEGRPDSDYPGSQRANYDAWLAADPARTLWSYQSCDEHGCGSCGTPSPGVDYTGWPNRVIDSSAVQDRAFPWHAFRLSFTGELYFDSTYQLSTAWDDNGQCAFSGSGDGTIFYPGTPAKIGGTTDIPVDSIRMKMIREGMEDYEYLVQAAAIDPARAMQIANDLFPHTYESAQTHDKLEAARDELFAMLDNPGGGGAGATTGAGQGGASTGHGAGSTSTGAGPHGATTGAGGSGGAASDDDAGGSSGCGCREAGTNEPSGAIGAFVLALGAALSRRSRARR